MSTSNLHPNAAGNYTNWTTQYPDSGSHYDKVDEITHDSDTTYIEYMCMGATPGVIPFLRLGGVDLIGSAESLTNQYAEYSQVIARPGGGDWTEGDLDTLEVGIGANPAVANGLVKDSFNLQEWSESGATINSVTVVFVCRQITGKTNYVRCTQAYVTVDYTEDVTITPVAVSCISSVVNPVVAIDLPITPGTISFIASTIAPIVYPMIIIPVAISCLISSVVPQVKIAPFPAPTAIEIDHQSSLATNVSEAPKFTAVFNGNDMNDVAIEVYIQVAYSELWGITVIYSSGWLSLSSPGCADGERCEGIIYGTGDASVEVLSSHPILDEYYVRFKFRDSLGTESEWSDTVSGEPSAFKGINRNWALSDYAARCKLYVDTDHADAIPAGWDLPFSFKTGERVVAATNGCFNEAVQASGGFQIAGHGSKLFWVYLSKQDPTHASAFYAIYIIESSDGGETWSAPVKIDNAGHYFDTHYFPTLVVDKLGYIHVAYGAHSGYFKYTRSTNAADISSWWSPDTITGFAGTYPVGILVPTKGGTNGRVYWFWRNANEHKNSFIYSDNGGTTWSSVHDFIIDTDASAYRVYCYGYRYDLNAERLHVAYTHNHTGDVEKGIWYISCDLDDVDSLSGDYGFNIWHWADGDVAGYSTGASGSAVDYNTGKAISLSEDHMARIFVECLELDASGDPIVFWEQDTLPKEPTNETRLVCATWNGSSWDIHYVSDQVNRMLRVRRSSIGCQRDKDNIIRIIMPVRANTWWDFNPTTDIDSVDITRKSEASNYLEVDEGPTDCDEDGSYFDVGTSGGQASFSSNADMIDGTREIFTLEIRAIVKHLGTSTSCYLYVEDGSVEDDSSSISITSSSYNEKSATWDINPFTSVAWTESDLDSLQFGIKQAGANEFRVTRVFARAQYTLQSDAEWGASEIYELTSSDNGTTWQMSRELSRNSGIGVPMMNSAHHLHNNRIHVIWSSGFDLFYFTDKRFGLVQFSGDDVRIMYAGVEIDRVLDYANKNETLITFKCQESIPANRRAGPDDYYLYFGNPNETTAAKSDPHGVYDRDFQNWEQREDNEDLHNKDGWVVSGGTALAYASPPNHANKMGAGELNAECTPSAGNFAMVKTIGSGLTNVQLDIFIWMEGSGGDNRAWAEFEDSGGNIFGAGLDRGEVRAAYKVDSAWTNSFLYANGSSMNHLRLRVTSAGCSAWWNGDEIVFEYNDSLAITSVDKLRLACNALTFFDFSRVGYSWERTDVSDPEVIVQSEEWRGLRIDATLLGRGSDSFIIDATIWGLKMGGVTAITNAADPAIVITWPPFTPDSISCISSVVAPVVILGSITLEPTETTAILNVSDPVVVLGSTTALPAAASVIIDGADPVIILSSIALTPSATACVASSDGGTVILGSMTATSSVTTIIATTTPTVILSSTTASPGATAVLAIAVDPGVVLGSVLLTPSAATIIAGIGQPTVILGSVTITATVSTLASSNDPVVHLSSTSSTPEVVTIVLGSLDPQVVLGSLSLFPTVLSCISSANDPNVHLGSTTASPGAITAIASVVDPTVVLGSITLSTTPVDAYVSSVDPDVIIGDIIVTPTTVSIISSTVNPTIELGSLIAIPVELAVIASTFDCTIHLGSTTSIPAANAVVLATQSPTVVIGAITIVPLAVTTTISVVDPSIVLGSFTVAPASSVAVIESIDPAVHFGSTTSTPVATTVIIGVQSPIVVIGTIMVSPIATTTIISVVDPAIILGSLSLAPTATSTIIVASNPVVILGSVTITAVASAVVSVSDPSVVIGDTVVTPTAVSAVSSASDPALVFSSTSASPTAITAIVSVFDPTVIGGSITISPTALSVRIAAVDPLVVIGAIIVTPAAISVITTTLNPGVVLGSTTVIPSAIAVIANTSAPSVLYGSTSTSPVPVVAIVAASDPTVVVGAIVFTPVAVTAHASTVDPIVVLGSTIAQPTAVSAVIDTVNPVVELGSISLLPTAVSVVVGIADPVVVLGDISIQPSAVSIRASTDDPTVILGSITVQPTPVSAILSSENPVVTGGSITILPVATTTIMNVVDPDVIMTSMSIQPAAINVRISVIDPNVIIPGINVSPAAVVVIAGVVDPSTILGSTQVSPTAAVVYTSTSDPILVLGSLSISPGAVDAITGIANPTVVFGALVITPESSQMVTVVVAPDVVYGSTISVPNPVSVVVDVLAPTVIETGIVLVLPDGRTVIVGQEDRMFTVPADDRGVLVASEDRISTISRNN